MLWCDKTILNWIKAIFKEENKSYENLRKRTASRLERGGNTTIHLFTILSMMCKAIVNAKRLWMQNNCQCNALNDIDHTRWLGVFIERVPPTALHHLNIYLALATDSFSGTNISQFGIWTTWRSHGATKSLKLVSMFSHLIRKCKWDWSGEGPG